MKVQTMSIVAGSEACNARCPFCVSKMTPDNGLCGKEPEVNWRNFNKAARLAQLSDVTTILVTGKGEPTLFPEQITKYLKELKKYDFPLIELQTNGIALSERREKYDSHLKDWYDNGLTTIALSMVDYDPKKNKEIYSPHKENYINLPELIDYLHEKGFSVRLTNMMIKGGIDSVNKLEKLVEFSKEKGVEQLTVRPISKPEKSENNGISSWVEEHTLDKKQLSEIKNYLDEKGTLLLELVHGATVYDVGGQNICLSNCLTRDIDPNKMRQLIFFPDGHLRYDWEKKGAVLL